MPSSSYPQPSSLLDQINRRARKGHDALHIISKHLAFMDALETDLGRILLSDLIEAHDSALERLIVPDAPPSANIEYNLILQQISRWNDRIQAYQSPPAK